MLDEQGLDLGGVAAGPPQFGVAGDEDAFGGRGPVPVGRAQALPQPVPDRRELGVHVTSVVEHLARAEQPLHPYRPVDAHHPLGRDSQGLEQDEVVLRHGAARLVRAEQDLELGVRPLRGRPRPQLGDVLGHQVAEVPRELRVEMEVGARQLRGRLQRGVQDRERAAGVPQQ